MADLGAVDCAAGVWLQRLEDESRLPPRTTLEVLRRRELSSKQQALALADAAQHAASVAEERLKEQKELSKSMEEALRLVKLDLADERRLRKEAELRLEEASKHLGFERRARENEVAQRLAAEVVASGAEEEVRELKAILADDESLLVIDEMSGKLEAQRTTISDLRTQLEVSNGCSESLREQLVDSRGRFEALEEKFSKSRSKIEALEQQLVDAERLAGQLRAKLQTAEERGRAAELLVEELRVEAEVQASEMNRLREAGRALQESADVVLSACESRREVALRDQEEEARRKSQRREVGVNTETVVVLEPGHPILYQAQAMAAGMGPVGPMMPPGHAPYGLGQRGQLGHGHGLVPPPPTDSGERPEAGAAASRVRGGADPLSDATAELIRAIDNISNTTRLRSGAPSMCMPNPFASSYDRVSGGFAM